MGLREKFDRLENCHERGGKMALVIVCVFHGKQHYTLRKFNNNLILDRQNDKPQSKDVGFAKS